MTVKVIRHRPETPVVLVGLVLDVDGEAGGAALADRARPLPLAAALLAELRPQVILAERVQPGLAAQAVEEVGGEAGAVARDAERDAPLAPAFLPLGVLDHGGEVGAGILPDLGGHLAIEQRQATAVLDGVAPERVVVQVDP
jgi:hypothetical protein